MRTGTLAAAGLLTIALAGGCYFDFTSFNWDDYRYSFEDSYARELEGVNSVRLEITNGRITVETWEMDRIEIAIEEKIKADTEEEAEELAEEIKLRDERSGGNLELTLDYGDYYDKRKNYAAILEIKIPARMNIDLQTTNGKITISEIEGDATARSTNGGVEINGCRNVEARTTNGKIVILNARERTLADTTNGAIEVKSIAGPLECTTTNGHIEAEIENPLGGDVILHTTNGGISLTLHPDSSCRIEASTTNGRISDDARGEFDYNRRRTSMEGRIGGGEHRVRLGATNGGIDISTR